MVSVVKLYIFELTGAFHMAEIQGSGKRDGSKLTSLSLTSISDENLLERITEETLLVVRTTDSQYLSGSVVNVEIEHREQSEMVQITCKSADASSIQPVPFTQNSLVIHND